MTYAMSPTLRAVLAEIAPTPHHKGCCDMEKGCGPEFGCYCREADNDELETHLQCCCECFSCGEVGE